jgi:LPXTG-site transpeptidase (sortase) family protein
MGKSLAASVLIGLGIVLILAAGGIVGYARYAQWQYASRAAPGPREVLPAQVSTAPTRPVTPPTPGRSLPPPGSRDWVLRVPTPTDRASASAPRRVLVPPVPRAIPDSSSQPAAEPAREHVSPPPIAASQPTWITIPKIGVSVTVTPVGVQDGEYVVPLWEVGHHEDSPNPGALGNAIMNGHLETISAGHVFAYLNELTAGDAVYTYTDAQRLTWAIRETTTVPNTDRAFLGPTPDRRLTLYTCTGTFNPIAGDYSHRLVVVAELAEADPLTP